MEVKSGYKQTEVGVIPEDWDVKTIDEICFYQNGTALEHYFNNSDGHLVISIGNYSSSGKFVETGNYIYKIHSIKLKKFLLRKNELAMLLNDKTSVGTIIGRVLLIDQDDTYIFNQRTMRLASKGAATPAYLYFQINSDLTHKRIVSLAKPGTQIYVNTRDITELNIPLPPTKDEQEAIAEALSDADALIESLEQLLNKKCHLKQGAMQELLTGKKRLPGFKEKWGEKTFDEIFDFYPTATNSRNDLNPEGDTFYIHYGDIHTRFHNHLDFSRDLPPKIERQCCKNAALLRNGDWIMVDASEDFDGIAKAVEVTGLNAGTAAVSGLHTFLLREKVPIFALGFKGHLRNLHSLQQQLLRVATGMKVFGVSKTALRNLFLPVPPPEEQTAIAAILSDMDAEIAALEAKLAKARQLKQGMMQELLTGRIRLVQRDQEVSKKNAE
ncbi:restriction endonuclease subunit S [Candidatus Nitronereus thalassa]|uniref:Restriction endonuclease subunit S n=1 Tax=Candidatus Nitronereus thalassa TaxID=3020898 RepID=A0ABU3KAQ2_9BACT|nr:restriction endonuclease subunit S [Candidatus Nitronereus thalassa]MDT7043474.1 restriction endonuclease subunit S [Candidatus Nitronereus thalassa]